MAGVLVSGRTVGCGLYVSVDVETDGPIPGAFSLLSLGA